MLVPGRQVRLKRPMQALWFGSPDCMNRNAMPLAAAHSVEPCKVDSAPLSKRIESGDPPQSIGRLSVLIGAPAQYRRADLDAGTSKMAPLKVDLELTWSRGY